MRRSWHVPTNNEHRFSPSSVNNSLPTHTTSASSRRPHWTYWPSTICADPFSRCSCKLGTHRRGVLYSFCYIFWNTSLDHIAWKRPLVHLMLYRHEATYKSDRNQKSFFQIVMYSGDFSPNLYILRCLPTRGTEKTNQHGFDNWLKKRLNIWEPFATKWYRRRCSIYRATLENARWMKTPATGESVVFVYKNKNSV